MEILASIGAPFLIVLVLLLFAGLILSRMYRRATREVSLVKTGSGGKKVIMDGGTIVIPMLHEVAYVNMKTLRLEVSRVRENALITRDRMRVDVGVEFYLSVEASADGIARAAQTLGDRTFDVEQLRELIEGKLVDGLRSVAAQMTMDELHENRSDFVQQVQNTVSEDLLKNGLGLESVALTALDQTPFEHLDENNAFNAVGMRQLAEVIADSKKERARIDAEAETAVRQSAMEAAKRKLEIDREEEEAEIQKAQEIATLRAAQEAEIAARVADSERATEEARIAKERTVREAEILRERAIREAEIQKEQSVRASEIDKERAIEVADQERQIVVAQKSEEESKARASADHARAEAAAAAEAVTTSRDVAEAERIRQIAVIEAKREAERQATGVRLTAEAERDAAADRAESVRLIAQAEADATEMKAKAKLAEALAEAEGTQKQVEAENAISGMLAEMRVDLKRLEVLPQVVAEMVKPAEKIEGIRINQVTGLGGGDGGSVRSGVSPVNQAVDALSTMALSFPVLKELGEQAGIAIGDGVSGVLKSAQAPKPEADEPAETPSSPEVEEDAN